MTKQLKKLLCIFLMTRKTNIAESISHIHGWETGTMGWGEKQLQAMPFSGACSTVLEPSSPAQHTSCLQHRGQVPTAPCRCSSTMGSHHCGFSKCTMVSLSVICQPASSFHHTGRVCYGPGLISIWVWLHQSHKLYFIIKYTQSTASKHITLTQNKT